MSLILYLCVLLNGSFGKKHEKRNQYLTTLRDNTQFQILGGPLCLFLHKILMGNLDSKISSDHTLRRQMNKLW